jgi:trehalose 6-phosphate synthase
MPLDERINRHSALLNRVRKQDVHWWSETFLKALAEAEPVSAQMS